MTARSDAGAPSGASDNPASRKGSTRPKSLLDVPAAQRTEMSREDAGRYLRMSLEDKSGRDVPIGQVLAELPGQPPAQVAIIVDRIRQHVDVPVRLPVILMLSCFCSTPGRCVLWAYTVVVLTQTLGRAVTMSDLSDAFPWGFPTDEGAGLIWDAQKDVRGNQLDFAESWRG